MIFAWDNGESYSDHATGFLEAQGSPEEVQVLLKILKPEYSLVGVFDHVVWPADFSADKWPDLLDLRDFITWEDEVMA